MAHHAIENGNSKTEKVILQLMGMKTKWVRHNGSWVDMATIVKKSKVSSSEEKIEGETVTKKWWQFWR